MLLYRTEIKYHLKKKSGLPRNFVPRNDVGGRSFCDFCGKQLSWYENIPVLSWVFLGGKSKCCQKKLPPQYPLLELGMGVIFVLVGNHVFIDGGLVFGLRLVIISLLIFSAIFDWKHMILPDFSTFILIGLGGLIWIMRNLMDITYVYAALGSFLFLLCLHLLTKGKGMGMGDVKYVVFMGLLLGVEKTILAFYLAFIGGAVVGVAMIILIRKKKNSRMPFGPFLISATLISWFWGEKLLLYFYSWF